MANLLKEFVGSAAGSHFTLRLFAADDMRNLPDHVFALADGRKVYLETKSGCPVSRLGKGLYELKNLPGLVIINNEPDAP